MEELFDFLVGKMLDRGDAQKTHSYFGHFVYGILEPVAVPVQNQGKHTTQVKNDRFPRIIHIGRAENMVDFRRFPENVGDASIRHQVADVVLLQHIQKIGLGFPISEETVKIAGALGFIGGIEGFVDDDMIHHGIDHIGLGVEQPVENLSGKTGIPAQTADGNMVIVLLCQRIQHALFKFTLLLNGFCRTALCVHRPTSFLCTILQYSQK